MKRTLTTASLLALALIAGCATSSSRNKGEGAESIELNLEIAPGINLNGATYTINGPGGFLRTGTIDISHSTKFMANIGALPAGNGFTITITASSVDGSTSCSGSATFNVTAHTTNGVAVHLTCHEAPRTGGVLVNGSLNVCPAIDGVTVTPTEVLVGGTVAVSAVAHDSDSAPSPLTYAWTASSGTLSSSNSASPTFTCTAPGTATLTLTVSDGDDTPGCAATESVKVSCTQIFSANCQECLKSACGDLLTNGCDSLTDTALEGPAKGAPKSKLCNDSLACVVASHCGGTGDLSNCYCGTVSGPECVDDGLGNGACRTSFERSFEAVMPLDVPVRFHDASFAGGVAVNLIQCAAEACNGCL
jgi:hypothetical protein